MLPNSFIPAADVVVSRGRGTFSSNKIEWCRYLSCHIHKVIFLHFDSTLHQCEQITAIYQKFKRFSKPEHVLYSLEMNHNLFITWLSITSHLLQISFWFLFSLKNWKTTVQKSTYTIHSSIKNYMKLYWQSFSLFFM